MTMSRVLEQGDVYFGYRVRAGVSEMRRLDEVQRFFVFLHPDDRDGYRRLIVGRKRLPEVHTHERAWAFVAEVASNREALREPPDPATRPAGEGRYALADHDGHTHLAYVLEHPRPRGTVQRVFRIEPEASYVVAIRNPDVPAPAGTGLPPRRRPEYPEGLRARFAGRRFSAVDPPELLDHPGAELVIIGATEDPDAELGPSIALATRAH
jgi:hypothetical protein